MIQHPYLHASPQNPFFHQHPFLLSHFHALQQSLLSQPQLTPQLHPAPHFTQPFQTPALPKGDLQHALKPADNTPANTSKISPTPTSPSNTSDPQTQTSLTLPAVTDANTTETAPSAATPPTTKSVKECSVEVTTILGGFQINMTSAPTGDYIISIYEKGLKVPEKEFKIFNKTSAWSEQIKPLKPCTEYEHRVELVHSDGNTLCKSPENKTRTGTPVRGDIEYAFNYPGHVCYESDWDISSSLSKTFYQHDIRTLCFNISDKDFCSDFTLNVAPENCVNSSFTVTKQITIDFLNPDDIDQTKPTGLPAQINPKIPPNCKNLTVDYSCSESSVNLSIDITELEPFTDYNCTGLIKDNGVFINKTTRPLSFKIDCDLTTTYKTKALTNISTELVLETTSKNCPDVSNLRNLSYQFFGCKCENDPTPPGGTCKVTGLTPYKDYSCGVGYNYKNRRVDISAKHEPWNTLPGTPEDIGDLTVAQPDNNVIKVTCAYSANDFRGPENNFIARLHNVDGSQQTKRECSFEFKDLSYLTTYTVEVVADNGALKSKPSTVAVHTSYNDKALMGFLVFLIILTSVALLVVVYKIYILKRRKSCNLIEGAELIPRGNDEENLMLVDPIGSEVLLETYKRKLADEGRLFLAEFQSIPRIFSRYTVKEAKKNYNGPKNRYVDILPYDHNRVQLNTGNGEAGCDYINASFIDGYKEQKKYIAAQGPKEETVTDFWRMVWEQQSSVIVMVTRCEEGNRVKCAQYWPSQDRETEIFEEFIVKLTSEKHFPDYTIRHISLSNKREKNAEREVTHIQFMSWPDHGVPGEPHLLLKLRRRVNAFKNLFSGPIVVHCSAGVGRTGTYIGIDAMMEGLEAEGRVDIYGYVVRLRRQRCLMVQVEAQYILIHQALLEHNQFGETEISLPELHSTVNTLKHKTADTEPSLMEEEFERLPSFKNWRTFNTGMSEENKKKNRSSSVYPYDYNRVLLKVDEGLSQDSQDPDEEEEEESSDEEEEDSTQYINASHIDGYWGPRSFIVAQTPVPDTLGDFWSMIHQKKACTVVMLSASNEGDKDNDSAYWDQNKKVFGEIEVEVTNTETSTNLITRTMMIRHIKRRESRPVKHFQFLKWDNRELPEKPQDLTDMIKDIKNKCETSKSQRGIPIVVHCNDGSSRSGIFCALWNLLDSAESEKLVDVFQVVKTLRKERQGMISSLEQYQFLYSALEGVFPVQNGDAKQVKAAAADSVQIVNETKEQHVEEKAEQPASTTSSDRQDTTESTPLKASEDKEKENVVESSPPKETTPLQDSSNGPTVTAEV
ncbi:receptor-type tyrosine-protein phosphatase C isoform 2-T2 [Menidia menidia]